MLFFTQKMLTYLRTVRQKLGFIILGKHSYTGDEKQVMERGSSRRCYDQGFTILCFMVYIPIFQFHRFFLLSGKVHIKGIRRLLTGHTLSTYLRLI